MGKNPRRVYREYRESLIETGDEDSAESYEEWLEAELAEMWDYYGCPYF